MLTRHKRCVLTFHGIIRGRYENVAATHHGGLTVAELDQIISWVRRHFNLLTPKQFLESEQPGVMLTFDDGMANNYKNALPILEHHDAPAVWFVSTQHIVDPRNWLPYSRKKALEFWANEKEIPEEWKQELFDGMSEENLAVAASHPLVTIGSHTISHPFLTHCNDAELERELVESRQYLEKTTKQTVDFFAYPTGDYDRRVACAVRNARYRAAFGLPYQGVGMPLYDISRIGIYQANENYLDAKLSGFPRDHWC